MAPSRAVSHARAAAGYLSHISRPLAIVALLVPLAACGSSADEPAAEPGTAPATTTAPGTTTGPSNGPPEEPPVPEEGGPPPAWIETPAGSAWMSFGRYCWGDVCVESVQATSEDSSVPQLDLAAGHRVRLLLDFEPDTAELTPGDTIITYIAKIGWTGAYRGWSPTRSERTRPGTSG